jgi:hypothetical protein
MNWADLLELSVPALRESALHVEPRLPARKQHAVELPRSRSHFLHASCSITCQLNDFWETLSYTLLWLCGVVAIVLC